MSAIQQFANKHSKQILEGRFLAIDPSSGSRQSLPGYAIYNKGQLEEAGVIEIGAGQDLSVRLHELLETLQNDFTGLDLVCIEQIPLVSFGKGKPMGRSMRNLQRSIGVTQAVFGNLPVCEMPIRSWKARAPAEYVKTDDQDAIAIGFALIQLAAEG